MSAQSRLGLGVALGILIGCTSERKSADLTAPSAAIKRSGPELFSNVTAANRLSIAEQARMAEIESRAWVTEPSLLRLNPEAVGHVRRGTAVNYSGASRGQVSLRKRRGGKIPGRAAELWVADAEGGERMHVDAVVDDTSFTGTLQDAEGNYVIEPLGGGTHIRYKVDPRRLLPEHDPSVPNGAESVGENVADPFGAPRIKAEGGTAGLLGGVTQSVVDNGAPYIKVLVVFTPEAAAAVGGSSAVDFWASIAVDQANQSYLNSYVQQTLLLTSVMPVSYTSTGKSTNTMVNQLASINDGNIDAVHTWRAQQMADVVIMLTGTADYCGEARQINATASTAFAVVDIACVTSNNYSFHHEIGHLQGGRHNLFFDGNTSPYVYGHGYTDPQGAFRTIMAIPDSCGGCIRLNYWSTLNVVEPSTGRPLGEATYSNDATVLNSRSWQTRDFVAPAPVFYVQQLSYGSGQRPRFSWQASAGATQHTAYRCEYGSSYCSSLFASYASYGTTREVEDVTRTLSGGYPPCARPAKYYVVAYHPVDGVSAASGIQPVVCLQ
jgi:peptidyl-Asp metalloendopeptidase